MMLDEMYEADDEGFRVSRSEKSFAAQYKTSKTQAKALLTVSGLADYSQDMEFHCQRTVFRFEIKWEVVFRLGMNQSWVWTQCNSGTSLHAW